MLKEVKQELKCFAFLDDLYYQDKRQKNRECLSINTFQNQTWQSIWLFKKQEQQIFKNIYNFFLKQEIKTSHKDTLRRDFKKSL